MMAVNSLAGCSAEQSNLPVYGGDQMSYGNKGNCETMKLLDKVEGGRWLQQHKQQQKIVDEGDDDEAEAAGLTLMEMISNRQKENFESWGDNILTTDKADGTLRLMSQNQDRFGSKLKELDGEEQVGEQKIAGKTNKEKMISWKTREVDVLMLQDTAWQDPVSLTQPGLYSGGKGAAELRRNWGGARARVVTAQGYKNANSWVGGVAIGTKEELKPYAGRKIADERGLGRYVITELIGANGCTVAMVSWYLPTRNGGAWMVQEALMAELRKELEDKAMITELDGKEKKLEAELTREDATPKTLLLADVMKDLLKLGCQYVVIGGDSNTAPPEFGEARSSEVLRADNETDRLAVKAFCAALHLVEPYWEVGQGEAPHDVAPATWRGRGERGEQWSWIDYWLVSKEVCSRGLVRGCGVLQETTDHAAIYLDLDMDSLLGRSELWKDIEALKHADRSDELKGFGVVRLNNEGRLRGYREQLRELCEVDGGRHELFRQVEGLYQQTVEGNRSEDIWQQAEEAMTWWESTAVEAQTKLMKLVQPETGGGKCTRKHHYSLEFLSMAQTFREVRRLLYWWENRHTHGSVRLKRVKRIKKRLGDRLPRFSELGVIPDNRSTLAQWERWISELQGLMAELRAKMHNNRRRKMRMKVQQRNKKLKDWVENDQQGKAFKNVQKMVRDGAVEAATVRMADGKKRAAKSGAEVVEHHYEEAQDWMGRKHRRWYYTAEGCLRGEEVAHDSGMERHVLWRVNEDGTEARQKLADGTYMEEQRLKEGLPECFHGLAADLQSAQVGAGRVSEQCSSGVEQEEVRRIQEADYDDSGLGEVIEAADWGAKGGTRGGASGVHADLLKACYKDIKGVAQECDDTAKEFGEMARQLVCIARLRRQYYASWKEELLYYFVKNPGMTGLENSRPVGLLEVLYKCSEAFDSAAMMSVWRRLGVLQPEQWAYQEGRGCEGPLLIWMLLGEEAYLNREDIAEGETDSERAFDAPTPEAIAIAEKRMGLPQWRIDAELGRKRTTNTRVITPFGLTDRFIRIQGIAQGGASSPAEWLMLIDSLAAYVKRVAPAAPGALVDERGGKLSVWLNLLADDQGYAAAGKDCAEAIEQRIKASTTWGTFFGINTKHLKSWYSLGLWGDAVQAEGSRMVIPERHGVTVKLIDEYRRTQHTLREVGPYTCNRILGQQRSLAQYPEKAMELAAEELNVTVLAVRQMPKYKWLAERVCMAVGWRRLAYRLRFAYVFGSQLNTMAMPMKKALTAKLGLPPGTPLGALHSAVMMATEDGMLVERTALLVKLLNTEDMRGWALRGAIQRQQQYEGIEQAVMQAGNSRCKCKKQCGGTLEACKTAVSWSGTWIGMVKQGMEAAGFTMEGGLGLPKLRQGDFCLVDVARQDDKEMVRRGCMATEMWRCSEVMSLRGDALHKSLMKGGPAEKAATQEWCTWVRQRFGARTGSRKLRRSSEEHRCIGSSLGRWDAGASWSWQVVGWRGTDGEQCMGKPVGKQGNRVKVQVLQRCRLWEYEQMHGGSEAAWAGTTMTKDWNRKWHTADSWCWIWDGVAGEVYQESWMEQEELVPVGVERWERKERHAPRILYRVAEWWEDSLELGVELGEGQEEVVSACAWHGGVAEDAFNIEYSKCSELMETKWHQGILRLFTDGGLDEGGTAAAQGQYGAVAAWLEGDGLRQIAHTGGVCCGPREWMSSHRSELMGVIAGLAMCCVWGNWCGKLQVWLDNEAVQRGCQKMVQAMSGVGDWHAGGHLMAGKREGYSNRESWLWDRDDRDLWEVLEQLVEVIGAGRLQFEWVKGHMDEVEGHVLTWQEEGNVAADAVCGQWKGIVASEEEQLLPRKRSWRLLHCGIEIISPVRKAMERILSERRLRHYLAEVRGWGSEAISWMDGVNSTALRMKGLTVAKRVLMVKFVYGLMATDDVVAGNWCTQAGVKEVEKRRKSEECKQMAVCALCGQSAVVKGSWAKNWHLIAECTDKRVVQIRREFQAGITLAFEGQKKLKGYAGWLQTPWLLEKDGTLRSVGTANELAQVMEGKGGRKAMRCTDRLKELLSREDTVAVEQWRLLYKGYMSSAWQGLLVDCGLTHADAEQVRRQVQRVAAEYAEQVSEEYRTRKFGEMIEGKEDGVPERMRGIVRELTEKALNGSRTLEERSRKREQMERRSWKRKLEWAAKLLGGGKEAKNMRREAQQLKRRQAKRRVVRCKVADAESVRALRVWLEGNAEGASVNEGCSEEADEPTAMEQLMDGSDHDSSEKN